MKIPVSLFTNGKKTHRNLHLQVVYINIHKTVFASEWVQGKHGKNLDFFTSSSKTSVGNKKVLFHVLQKETNVSAH